MRCNKCNTIKPMGTSMVRNQAGIAVPAWVCSSCGQDIIIEEFRNKFCNSYKEEYDGEYKQEFCNKQE